MNDIFYGFMYNDCVYESSYALISLHTTKNGAYKAMKKYILNGYEEWRELNDFCRKAKLSVYGTHEDWFIKEIILLE